MTKPTLLIVEDDEDIRTQMKWALASDYEVVTADDRGRAVAAFTAKRPAVVPSKGEGVEQSPRRSVMLTARRP